MFFSPKMNVYAYLTYNIYADMHEYMYEPTFIYKHFYSYI